MRSDHGPVNPVVMDIKSIAQDWQNHGFVVLPGYIPSDELATALGELEQVFPTPQGFHDGTDPRCDRFIGDEFAGIDTFPFASVELSLLVVNEHLVRLARMLLGDDDLRIYSAE